MYRRGVSLMYEGERLLGEVEVVRQDGVVLEVKEIRISHFSPPSERCPPLAVLHTVNNNAAGMCWKLESAVKTLLPDSPLSVLHATCLRDNKAAVASTGQGEIHLVAMHSRKYDGQNPCFWGFNVASSVYNSSLVMLNLRCLGIVFDLDETLIVANTMRSFEDRIEALQRKISLESDPHRLSGMQAEVKRYQEDKHILKQYADSDQVIDNGKLIKSQSEVVLALSDNHQTIVRPLIRLQDKNIILTRINPQIRDTSVLVRLRPAWEDLRSYLTARGRKRFEVFVCTMAERDYALEMWRLLDPESNLINSRELLDRIVCVKSGNKKSLFNVFQDGNCHPKMSLVIDDRLKVWDEKDQPRVHVVPAFAPYYAPQAEANNAIPVLCVARNVACNVRGGFFKDFDEGLLQRISGIAYEDDIKDVPLPDVSNYLISEDDASGSNGNKDSVGFDGMADAEVERRLKEAISASSTVSPPATNLDLRAAPGFQYTMPSSSFVGPPQPIQGPALPFPSQQLPVVTSLLKPALPHLGQPEKVLRCSPAREEGEVPESELDPDTRRRLLILQHGQDVRELPPSEPHFPAMPPVQVPAPRVQPQGWFPVEGDSPGLNNRVAPANEFLPDAEPLPIDKHRAHQPPFLHKVDAPVPPGRVPFENQRLPNEALPRENMLRFNQPLPDIHSFAGEDGPLSQPVNKDPDLEAGQIDPYSEAPAEVLHDIAFKCGTKVEFIPALVSSTDLQFAVEVLFAGEKIGEGLGRTRKEARRKAAEGSLIYLADKFLSQSKPDPSYMIGDGSRFGNPKGNGFIGDVNSYGYEMLPRGDGVPFSTSAPPRGLDPRVDTSKKAMGAITALEELCAREGFSMAFHQFSSNSGLNSEVHAQAEINGQIAGEGIGLTWDEAKSQAAENALGTLKSSMHGPYPYRHQDSPRSMQSMPNKRLKTDFSRNMQRLPSSNSRYPKGGASLVP